MILLIILSSLLPDSVKVALFGGSLIKSARIKVGGKIFKISVEGGFIYVNGVKKKVFHTENPTFIEPVEGKYKGVVEFTYIDGGIRVINKVPLDDYLASVVASESGDAPLEALKAQTILARTFLVRWGLRHGYAHTCDSDHCQVYLGFDKVKPIHYKAVKETEGEILSYEGKPVEVLFHASCGGWFCEPKYIWKGGRDIPYFWTGEDPDCFKDEDEHYTWKVFVPLKTCPYVKRIPGTLRAYIMVLDGDTLYAYDFREKFGLPSAVFAYWCTSTGVIFIGTGRGHGTGLCQRGAMLKANRGWTYKEILEFYYKGASVVRIR